MKTPDKNRKDFLIVALDFPDLSAALRLVDTLKESVSFYKVGAELFFRSHSKAIQELRLRNKKIFLDLKLNDIPRTISRSALVLAGEGVDYISLFTSQAGVKAVRDIFNEHFSHSSASGKVPPKILNVTVLTSREESENTAREVLTRSRITRTGGGDGVICSGWETKRVKEEFSSDFLVVNPGVRLDAQATKDDQKRVVTPEKSFLSGADHIVVGRPIHSSKKPLDVVQKIFDRLHKADF